MVYGSYIILLNYLFWRDQLDSGLFFLQIGRRFMYWLGRVIVLRKSRLKKRVLF